MLFKPFFTQSSSITMFLIDHRSELHRSLYLSFFLF
jgi:hypothetical protein